NHATKELKKRSQQKAIQRRLTVDPEAVATAAVAASSRASSPSSGNAPFTRLPSSKIIAGVPRTSNLRPNAKLASIGVSHCALGGASLRSICARQASTRSAAHQILRALAVESGERIGYSNVYTV